MLNLPSPPDNEAPDVDVFVEPKWLPMFGSGCDAGAGYEVVSIVVIRVEVGGRTRAYDQISSRHLLRWS